MLVALQRMQASAQILFCLVVLSQLEVALPNIFGIDGQMAQAVFLCPPAQHLYRFFIVVNSLSKYT